MLASSIHRIGATVTGSVVAASSKIEEVSLLGLGEYTR